jgi:hypothetical protein
MLFFAWQSQRVFFHGPQDCKQRTKEKIQQQQQPGPALAWGHKLFTNQFVYLKKSPFTAAHRISVCIAAHSNIISEQRIYSLFCTAVFRPPWLGRARFVRTAARAIFRACNNSQIHFVQLITK